MNVFTIESQSGLKVTLGDLGARIIDITLDEVSVVARYPNLQDYQQDPNYLGATIGPIANRLQGGALKLAGQTYQLRVNESGNSLHGGMESYDKAIWKVENHTKTGVEFKLSIQETDNPLPGSIDLIAHYQVQDKQLLIDYHAQTSDINYLNLTNHVYLNLNADRQSIKNHEYVLFADSFLISNRQGIPSGESTDIKCPLNYSPLAHCDHSQLNGAVDHHFNISPNTHDGKITKIVEASSPESKISVAIYSNKPGFQFYTGQYLKAPMPPYAGFCVEPQYAPNAPNDSRLHSPFCSAEKPYRHRIRYQFDWPCAH